MISISCADYSFPLLPRERRFALLRLLGFEYVDLGLCERSDGLRPGLLLTEPRKFARQLKRDLIHSGLQASDIFLQTGLTLEDAAENDPSMIVRSQNRKTFILTLELCAELECTHVTGLPGVLHKGVSEKDSFNLAVDEMRWRQRVASSAGICYAVKPIVGSICSGIDQTRALLDAVPGLTLTLDYGQFVFQKVGSRQVHSLLPSTSHLHVHGGAPRRLQVPMNENEIDFASIVKRLYKNQYKGFIAISYLHNAAKQCNHTDNVSETILLRNHLIENLRSEAGEAGSPDGRFLTTPFEGPWPQASPEIWGT